MKNQKMISLLFILVILALLAFEPLLGMQGRHSTVADRLQVLLDAREIVKSGILSIYENPMMRIFLSILFLFATILTIFMTIDCAVNKREAYWFVILWMLFPAGAVCYLIYFWETITVPYRVAAGFPRGDLAPSESRRCSRCQRAGVQLVPCEDGRQTIYICEMCRSEMDIRKEL